MDTIVRVVMEIRPKKILVNKTIGSKESATTMKNTDTKSVSTIRK